MKSIPEVCNMLNLTEDQLYRRCAVCEITPKKIKNVTMFTDEEIEELSSEPKYMSASELALYLGVEKKDLVLSTKTIERNGKILYNVEETRAQTPDPKLQKLTMRTLRAMFHMPEYRMRFVIPDVMKTIAKRNNGVYPSEVVPYLEEHFSIYANVREISKSSVLSEKEIEFLIDINNIEPVYTVKNCKVYIISEVRAVMTAAEIDYVQKQLGSKRLSSARRKVIDDAGEYIKAVCNNLHEKYDFHQTIDVFQEHMLKELKNSTSKDPLKKCMHYSADYYNIIENIDKELSDYTTQELILLIDMLPSESAKSRLGRITSYMYEKNISCGFYPITYSPNYNRNVEVYTKDEWRQFAQGLLDIDVHIERALEKPAYAEAWLLQLSHLFLAWRLSDFIKLPVPSMPFTDEISLAMAELIINDMSNRAHGLTTGKTDLDLYFVHPPLQYVIPFATAVMICKHHHENYLISKQAITGYKYFSKISGIAFHSRKANKTLMTYSYIVALSKPGYADIAYTYAAIARSHAIDEYGLSDTSERYLVLLPNSYGDLTDEVVVGLCNNGTFGFLYEDLLEILTKGNSKGHTFQERSIIIADLKKVFSPAEAEDIAAYMLKSMDERKTIIEEYQGRVPELRKLLDGALKNNNSKIEGVICAKLDECSNSTVIKCWTCPYALIPYHMIAQIGGAIRAEILEHERTKPNTEGNRNYRKKLRKDIYYLLELASCFRQRFSNNRFMMELLKLPEVGMKEGAIDNESKSIANESEVFSGDEERSTEKK